MSNPLFKTLNGGRQSGSQIDAFRNFMNAHRGQDPNAMIQQIVQSGKLSQAQLDQIQHMAGQMGGMFDGLKSAFGF